MDVNQFQNITFDESKNILIVRLNENTSFITDEDVKNAHFEILAKVKIYKPKFFINNVKKLLFAISPDLQEWIRVNITFQIFELGIQKIAYIMPDEFIEKLAIESITDEMVESIEEKEANIIVNYFDNENSAFEWFKKEQNNTHNSIYKNNL